MELSEYKICIIGLGLIGGSLARALRGKVGVKRIFAIDACAQNLQRALSDGNIDTGFPATDVGAPVSNISSMLYDSDIIFICTPHSISMEYLDFLKAKTSTTCIITDTGSTKCEIMQHAASLDNLDGNFIGGHPMTGSEKTGYPEGYAHMFENAYYILTPPIMHNKSDSKISAKLAVLKSIIKGIGAIPIVMDAARHDRAMAAISHLPHVIASTLVNLVRENETEDGQLRMLAAGGFKDITRIASSDPCLWEEITASNSVCIKELIESYILLLQKFKDSMGCIRTGAIAEFFENARKFRDAIPMGVQGAIDPSCDIVANVADRPGIIGDIATLLGKENINIKNINITNSRENEYGCLKLTLPDLKSVKLAIDLLSKSGYKVSS